MRAESPCQYRQWEEKRLNEEVLECDYKVRWWRKIVTAPREPTLAHYGRGMDKCRQQHNDRKPVRAALHGILLRWGNADELVADQSFLAAAILDLDSCAERTRAR